MTYLDDLAIALDASADAGVLREALAGTAVAEVELAPWITAEAVEGLKFAECLSNGRATEVVAKRLADPEAVSAVKAEQLGSARLP